MNVTADIELDIDDDIRELVDEVMSENREGYLTKDDLDYVYVTWSEYNEGWHEQMHEYSEAMEIVVASDLRELENQVQITRRVIKVMLEERRNRWYRRLGRFVERMIRRVHWHMPRR